MNKKMDVNFAFAILLLVAAIVGMYFFLDNANVEIEDIADGVQPMVIEQDMMEEEMMEDGMETEAVIEDAVVEEDMMEKMEEVDVVETTAVSPE